MYLLPFWIVLCVLLLSNYNALCNSLTEFSESFWSIPDPEGDLGDPPCRMPKFSAREPLGTDAAYLHLSSWA